MIKLITLLNLWRIILKNSLKKLNIHGGFYYLHPITIAAYFIFALIICFTSSSLTIAICSGVLAVAAIIRRNIKTLLYCLPMALFIAILNPLFNYSGETVLFTLFDRSYTLEAVFAGLEEAAIILCTIMIFSFFNIAMSDEKFMALSGRIFPKISIMLMMIFRHTALLKNAYEETKSMAEMNGISPKGKSLIYKLKISAAYLDGITSSALENSIDTGISMVSRGFLNKDKTVIRKYHFCYYDTIFILLFAAIFALTFWPMISPYAAAAYYALILLAKEAKE